MIRGYEQGENNLSDNSLLTSDPAQIYVLSRLAFAVNPPGKTDFNDSSLRILKGALLEGLGSRTSYLIGTVHIINQKLEY